MLPDPIRKFWRELMTPSSYPRDPYVEGANQISHTAIGAIATILAVSIWREINGEMPFKTPVFWAIFVIYILGIEYALQGWRGRDSYFDSFMVISGACFILVPFREISVDGKLTVLTFDHRLMLAAIAGWVIILAIHIWMRISAKYEAGS